MYRCGIGASENPCSGSYCGIAPFAEVEARSLASYIELREPVVYIDHHCCGDMYLEPWGWTEELPPDHDDIDSVWSAAKAATDRLYGRNYRQVCLRLALIDAYASVFFCNSQGLFFVILRDQRTQRSTPHLGLSLIHI